MLKMALFDCAINEKRCSVDGGRGICPLFPSPPGGFDSSRVPTPGNLPSKVKKLLKPGGQPGGRCWAQVELTGALIYSFSDTYYVWAACDHSASLLCVLFP